MTAVHCAIEVSIDAARMQGPTPTLPLASHPPQKAIGWANTTSSPFPAVRLSQSALSRRVMFHKACTNGLPATSTTPFGEGMGMDKLPPSNWYIMLSSPMK